MMSKGYLRGKKKEIVNVLCCGKYFALVVQVYSIICLQLISSSMVHTGTTVKVIMRDDFHQGCDITTVLE